MTAPSAVSRPAAVRELLVLVASFALFTVLHGASGGALAPAMAHARALQHVERTLHVDVERTANGWLAAGPTWLQLSAVDAYRTYYVVVAGVLAWLWVRHPEVYLRARRTLLAMMLLVLPVYWALPMAPPRFATAGVVDLVAVHAPLGASGRESGSALTAMPSMHVGFAAWCAYAVWLALRGSHPTGSWLAWSFPALMTAVVLATGNHYLLDVAGTAVLLAAAVGVAALWSALAARVGTARHPPS